MNIIKLKEKHIIEIEVNEVNKLIQYESGRKEWITAKKFNELVEKDIKFEVLERM